MRNMIVASAVIALLTCAPVVHAGGPLIADPARVAGSTAKQNGLPPRELAWPICADQIAGFGWRVDPFTGKRAFHGGDDFAAEFGAPVRAGAAGKVIAAERRGPYGNMIEIDHGKGLSTRYAQLQSIRVAPGDTVAQGQIVATVGSSGRSTGPHLHFEVWLDGAVWNPAAFLPPKPTCPDPAATTEALKLARLEADKPSAMPIVFSWPACGTLNAKFGYASSPATGRIVFHAGIDLADKAGVSVTAPAPGKVVAASERDSYGLTVEIDHGGGFTTRLGHLQSIAVNLGQYVARGHVVGTLGSTGVSNGPHVHFEVWLNKVVRNPLHYLEAMPECVAHKSGANADTIMPN